MRSLLSFILLILTLVTGSAQAQVLISTGGWPPFLTPDQKHFGFIAHLISDVFAETGREVDYQRVPWRRAYVGAVSGDYDATAVWMDAPDRHRDFLYSDPILDATPYLMSALFSFTGPTGTLNGKSFRT